jgi:predicted TIM-barrel fold metal-dependent hydrolase
MDPWASGPVRKKPIAMTRPLVSADSHVNEAPDLFETRLPAAMRERGPRIRANDDGQDCWVTEGLPPAPLSFGVHAAGKREEGEAFEDRGLFVSREEMVTGSYDPRARLADMTTDGLDAEVLYPGPLGGLGGGGTLAAITDTALRHACLRAYNDWLADFCAVDRDRLLGIGLVRIEETEFAVSELERVAALGLRGAIVNAMPDLMGAPALSSRSYDPFWAKAAELGLPLSLHILHSRSTPPLAEASRREAELTGGVGGLQSVLNHVGSGTGLFETYMTMMCLDMAEPVSLLIFSGLLERFPTLRFAVAESGIGWIPFTLERMDGIFRTHRKWMQTVISRPPSEYFHEHFFATFQQDDDSGLLGRYISGVDNLMWASDYPHTDTTFPHSHKVVETIFANIPSDETDKITNTNARRLYGLPVSA